MKNYSRLKETQEMGHVTLDWILPQGKHFCKGHNGDKG